MRKFRSLATTLVSLSTSVTALAESEIPDLKGTWMYTSFAIAHQKTPDANPTDHGVPKSGELEIDFTLTIETQDGFRFAGTRTSANKTEAVVGVIGFDHKTVYMVDSDGVRHGTFIRSPGKVRTHV